MKNKSLKYNCFLFIYLCFFEKNLKLLFIFVWFRYYYKLDIIMNMI